jgi:hypothetical protein
MCYLRSTNICTIKACCSDVEHIQYLDDGDEKYCGSKKFFTGYGSGFDVYFGSDILSKGGVLVLHLYMYVCP